MTTRIEMEQRLRAARPDVEAPAPPLSWVLARVEQGPEPGRAKRRIRRPARFVLPALVGGALLAAGGTAAALLLSSGGPVAPAFVLPASPHAGLGEPTSESLALLPMRVADPEGGAPWGMRVIRTTRGLACLQAGRVVGGQLGGIGSGYAFGGDQRFHPFLAEDAIATGACPAVGANGNPFLPGPPVIVPANALPLAGENVAQQDQDHCDLPGQENWGVRCAQPELRQVAVGLLGPGAKSIHVGAPGRSFTVLPQGPLGAYLIVLPAQTRANTGLSSGAYQGPFGYVSNAPGGAVLTVTYDDGSSCVIPYTSSGQQCHAHQGAGGEEPSAKELTAPVQATYVPIGEHLTAPLLMD
ncbi:MAG TPA: hypothetical protein VHS55_07525, partial [Solirubrobacteraceae bacterium]|nr:hypothetical protein [Solirubrobacteraceae bacterium]